MAQFVHRSFLREAAIAAIAAMASFAVLSDTAQAQPGPAAYYRAQLATPLDAPRSEIVGGVAWKCADAGCVAAKGTSRVEVVCGRLARKLGAVSRFSAAGEALDPARLAKCNRDDAPAVLSRGDDAATARP
jgi:hypothetical protein